VKAVDMSAESGRAPVPIHESLIPKDRHQCGAISTEWILPIGMPLILMRNIDIRRNLGNGTIGILRKIIYPGVFNRNESFVNRPSQLLIDFSEFKLSDSNEISDDPTNKDHPNWYKISPVDVIFDGFKGKILDRSQFPVVPYWAVTTHIMQGITLESAVVDLSNANFQRGQISVAISRVKIISGLFIYGNLSTEKMISGK
jgi:hypothetical protein